MQHIKLDEKDFTCLVRGGVLTVNDNLQLLLSDIGFEAMWKAIDLAERGINIYKEYTKDPIK